MVTLGNRQATIKALRSASVLLRPAACASVTCLSSTNSVATTSSLRGASSSATSFNTTPGISSCCSARFLLDPLGRTPSSRRRSPGWCGSGYAAIESRIARAIGSTRSAGTSRFSTSHCSGFQRKPSSIHPLSLSVPSFQDASR